MNAPAVTIGASKVELVQGGIMQQELEAIANAANSRVAVIELAKVREALRLLPSGDSPHD